MNVSLTPELEHFVSEEHEQELGRPPPRIGSATHAVALQSDSDARLATPASSTPPAQCTSE